MLAHEKPVKRLVMSLGLASVFISGGLFAEPLVKKTPAPRMEASRTQSEFVPGLIQYETPLGDHYSALILPAPPAPATRSLSYDHMVIVDTSASQTGEFRARSTSLANAFCSAIPAGDRVMLVAADLGAEILTTGFVAPNSLDVAQSFEKLNERIPLGSSNLEVSLRSALANFNDPKRGRSVLYLGDGFSTAQLIQTPSMLGLVKDLRAAKIPVSSYAIGPRTDLMLLGTLAQHTGGVLTIDEPAVVAKIGAQGTDAKQQGIKFVTAARSPIFYPGQLVSTPEIDGLSTPTLPPVRFDRETVLLASGVSEAKVELKLTGTLLGNKQEFSWKLQQETLVGSNGFLLSAWNSARASSGMAMPFAGREFVLRAHDEFQSQVSDLVDSAKINLQRKNLDQAETIAQAIQRLDPSNLKAFEIQAQAKRLRVIPVQRKRQIELAQAEQDAVQQDAVQAEDAAPQENPAVAPEDVEAPAPGVVIEGDATTAEMQDAEMSLDLEDKSNPKQSTLLEELSARQLVRIQELTSEVNQGVDEAIRLAKIDFGTSSEILKDLLSNVDSALELPESVRRPLRRKIESALLATQNDNEIAEQKTAALRTKMSQMEARKKLMTQSDQDEERMEQLIERVRALIIRGVKGESSAFEEAEEYARIAVELDPYNYVPNMAVFNSEAFGALDQARRMRALRADKYLAALYQVELAHVPFPDEPPVLWPSAERWREITVKREKWKSVDLKSYSKQEEKIVSALNKPMKEKFDFVDATLEDVRNKLIEVYEINVIIDKVKLEEESIATDAADINLVISDIMLKNALKLLLEPKQLTYSIQDEVLKITTKTDGTGKKAIKAVYAGDLATPVNPLFGSGGSGAGGQQGGGGQLNGGQQGGGFGGGGGGFGGGGGGGFGGGGGQGVFNIPPFQPKNQKPKSKPVLAQPAK